MKTYNIQATYQNTSANVNHANYCRFVTELVEQFKTYSNVVFFDSYSDSANTFECHSFKVNGMSNVVFCLEAYGTTIRLSIRKVSDIEGKNNALCYTNAQTSFSGGTRWTDSDGTTWYPYTFTANLNCVEKDGQLVAFIINNPANTYKCPVVFNKDNFGKPFIFLNNNANNYLYYDTDDYINCTLDTDSITTNIEGYVYTKKIIGIYKSSVVCGVTDAPMIICNTSLGTQNATTLQCIDVEGVRYRQLRAQYWIEDKEE